MRMWPWHAAAGPGTGKLVQSSPHLVLPNVCCSKEVRPQLLSILCYLIFSISCLIFILIFEATTVLPGTEGKLKGMTATTGCQPPSITSIMLCSVSLMLDEEV